MSVAVNYPFAEVESRVQKQWDDCATFVADEKRSGDKFYCLSMFPYPSGRLHMGHVRNYAIGDMIARYRRMLGDNVLQPLGWDAFGLPAENAAIDNNIAPAVWTRRNIDEMRAQLKRLGLAIDWRREFATCDADYYRWEQQLFVRLFRQGLIYKKEAMVNWDPVDNTVLANEQVVDGRGWRSGAAVERREIPMYFMRITEYADELLEELDLLEGWPESVKTMQKNWIGRSEGARIFFPLCGREDVLECFSTRPDTLFGATFCAIAPEHPLALECAKNNKLLTDFIAECRHLSVSEEALEKTDKRGYDTGLRVSHPFDPSKQLPVYVANFILMQYGTGAIFGCPAHDQRDLDFAHSEKLPVIPVLLPNETAEADFAIGDTAYSGDGTMINSEFLNGLDSKSAIQRAMEELEKNDNGRREQQYRLRDWGVSRQRYWGCPIPIIHCSQCGEVPEEESALPVLLPEDAKIDGRGSPLAKMEEFVSCKCPQCGAAARREIDTLDTFFESSWYFARFASHTCQTAMIDENAVYWMPVNQYVGGIEHACLHLLYARFFHKLMRDAKMYPKETRYNEPFTNLLCQGMVLNHAYYSQTASGRAWATTAEVSPQMNEKGKIIGGTNAAKEEVQYAGRVKMSKSFNNGVDPENLIAEWGADTARLFILFASPPEQSLDWSDDGVRGCARFLNRLWHAAIGLKQWQELLQTSSNGDSNDESQKYITQTRRRLHEILSKASYDMERQKFNNIPAAAMSMVNELQTAAAKFTDKEYSGDKAAAAALLDEGFSIVLRLLAPATPHIAQDLWQQLQFDKQVFDSLPAKYANFIADAPWPKADEAILAARESVVLAVQVNGKLRGQIEVATDISSEEAEKTARQLSAVERDIDARGGNVRKVIIVPNRVINFVVG